MRIAIIGTGYLGRVVVTSFNNRNIETVHTYNTQKYFPNSVKFDLFSQNLGDVLPLTKVDTVVFTSKIENSPNTVAVLGAMRNAFTACGNKRVIYISTDAVFDGQKGKYLETDATSPVTIYGKHKKLCEDLVREIVPNYCIIRPSYIYGFSLGELDSRLTDARTLIQKGQSLKRFVDMFKSPTEVNQLAEIIATASELNFQGVLHACGKHMSVYDFLKHGLTALGEQTNLLVADYIPENPPLDYLKDTSLNGTFLKKHFGFEPVLMKDALTSP